MRRRPEPRRRHQRGCSRAALRGDPRIIGGAQVCSTASHEIVGVMPRGFEFLEPGTDVWAPLPFDPTSAQHRAQFSQAFARLERGVTTEAATSELQACCRRCGAT